MQNHILAIIYIYEQVYMSLGVCVCIQMCIYEYVYAYVCVMCIYVHPPADCNTELHSCVLSTGDVLLHDM